MKRVVWGSVAFGLAAALGAGIPAAGAAPAPLVFMLDWFPNPDHVPLFAAQQEGWFTQEGLRVTLQIPANTDDPLKLAAAGRVDVAVNYEPNVIIARAQGLPVRSIGVLVGQPLITVMFLKSSGIRSPRDLVGRRVGFAVTGFADAMVDQMMHSAGAAAAGVRMVNVGFDLVPALLSHNVDAVVGAYRNYERVQIELQGQAAGTFEPEKYGVPPFYELVLITSDQGLARHREALARFVRAVGRGIAFTLRNPEAAFAAYVRANPTMTLDDELNRRSFRMTLPTYARSQVQAAARWREFDLWLAAHKVIPRAVPVDTLYTNLAP